jgi:hypothetical protein
MEEFMHYLFKTNVASTLNTNVMILDAVSGDGDGIGDGYDDFGE